MLHFYYGDGKGKTTAALGLAFRFSGQGKRAVVVQFLKNTDCGEVKVLSDMDITLLRGKCGDCFTCFMTERQLAETKIIHEDNLKKALSLIKTGDMLILDEAADAVELNLLDEQLFKQAILDNKDAVEIVVTGHKPLSWLMETADYITEMKKHKHPFDSGISARKGIEY